MRPPASRHAPALRCAGLAAAVALTAAATAAGAEILVDRARETGLVFSYFNGMSGELYFVEMNGAGGALFDYDNDGDLDAYLVQGHMLGKDKTIEQAILPPEHPLPLTDRLYRNDLEVRPDGSRNLRFTDVTAAAGLAAYGYGMGVTAGDYDNDGWVDLYVTNFGPNHMLHNDGDGSFTEVTQAAGTDDPRWSVAAAFLDFDRDGWLDLYVGNYVDFRIATHKFCSSDTGARDYCGPKAYPAEPDRLFRNRGDGTFEDVSAWIGSEYGAALGVTAADFNGDRWIDLYVANDGSANQLWINQRGKGFVNDALLAGCAVNEQGQPEASMGVVAGDFDGDGDADLFMTHLTRETNTFYRNEGGGMFEDFTQESGLGLPSWQNTGFGTALFDYDNDGWLDLFVANGAVKLLEEQMRAGEVYPLKQPKQLFRNLGGGRFEEVTAGAGSVLSVLEVSRGVAAGDVDNDGDTDLLVANNAGPARLLLNQVGQDRPWLGLRLLGKAFPRDMLGAQVAVFRPDAPTLWREVRTDGSYASAGDPRVLVGLGDAPAVEKVQVLWPDGSTEEFTAVRVGAYTTLTEGGGRAVE